MLLNSLDLEMMQDSSTSFRQDMNFPRFQACLSSVSHKTDLLTFLQALYGGQHSNVTGFDQIIFLTDSFRNKAIPLVSVELFHCALVPLDNHALYLQWLRYIVGAVWSGHRPAQPALMVKRGICSCYWHFY